MKEKFLKYEDINKDLPIVPEIIGKINTNNFKNITKELVDNFYLIPDYSEKQLIKNIEKNREELGFNKKNYNNFLIGLHLFDQGKYHEALHIFDELLIYFHPLGYENPVTLVRL